MVPQSLRDPQLCDGPTDPLNGKARQGKTSLNPFALLRSNHLVALHVHSLAKSVGSLTSSVPGLPFVVDSRCVVHHAGAWSQKDAVTQGLSSVIPNSGTGERLTRGWHWASVALEY